MMDFFSLLAPFLHRLPPEWAHRCILWALATGRFPLDRPSLPDLPCQIAGLELKNPLGLAAGFDKNGQAIQGIERLGFGCIEIGTLTLYPQPGNPKPRVFRLPEDQAIINRLGFNNEGLEAALSRLSTRPCQAILGINIGKNRHSANERADYARAVRMATPLADYLTINISSPNTPGLRKLQNSEFLPPLLDAVLTARDTACPKQKRPPPIFLKLSPDLSVSQCQSVAAIVLEKNIDGLIISNTTVSRPHRLSHQQAGQEGGLSGQPLFELSTRMLADMYIFTQGRLPLIGVGGISNGQEAYTKIKAGASLIQLYTGLIYQGPALIETILCDLRDHLKKDGYPTVSHAVGVEAAIFSSSI